MPLPQQISSHVSLARSESRTLPQGLTQGALSMAHGHWDQIWAFPRKEGIDLDREPAVYIMPTDPHELISGLKMCFLEFN